MQMGKPTQTKGNSKGKKTQGGGDKQYDDTNRGVLFMNDKDGNDARPDMTGHVAIDPDEFPVGDDGLIRIRLAAWNQNSDRAGDYLSLAASTPKSKE
jgi:hypothetical protein